MIGSKVSKRYAKALFGLGQEDGNFERYARDLQDFAGFCRDNSEFGLAITNRVFPLDERKELLNVFLERSSYSPVVKSFLNLLLEKDRMGAIDGITGYYGKLLDDFSNVARAVVLTPRPIQGDLQEALVKALETLTAKVIKLEVKEDRSLVGGIIVRIGDLVLDGSVKAQLQGLKESLKRGEYS